MFLGQPLLWIKYCKQFHWNIFYLGINPENHERKAEEKFVTVPGRQGLYTLTKSIHDKYDMRPKGVEELTLSQFATSYSKCEKKPKDVTFNNLGVSDKKGLIANYLSNQDLPQHIKLSSNEIVMNMESI